MRIPEFHAFSSGGQEELELKVEEGRGGEEVGEEEEDEDEEEEEVEEEEEDGEK